MGGSRPSAPTTYIPAPATPSLFISKVPEKDYQRAADLISRTEQMRQDLIQKRYKEVGTPEELGERQAGIRAQEAASYAASLPQGDRYLADITGVENQYRPAIEQAGTRLTQAQQDYARAIEETEKSREEPAPAPSPAPAPAPAPKPAAKRKAKAAPQKRFITGYDIVEKRIPNPKWGSGYQTVRHKIPIYNDGTRGEPIGKPSLFY